ncbi:hypothetical protein CHS0354_013128 [Potamilus streckersoni]|uniref:Cytochrome c domain-containing protein n=1 Tax=Potamilus streckersoni TaxID=2493646 RepID=A0AAE0S709_9BIVA|nr:hypothetical protein CHS0354_013128 [Potamilus streckersoni]
MDLKSQEKPRYGRIMPAPENFIPPGELKKNRRGFLKQSVAAGLAVVALTKQLKAEPDVNITQLPEHSTTLGKPVAYTGYGIPSRYEHNIQRRPSPGLTRTLESSVAFAPLQALFGIITPSGLHFERHHSGYHDIDPRNHRLMIHGLVKQSKVYTVEDIMRLPAISRIHFIECGANSGMEWGNVAVPTVQYTHGMLSCSEFTGVPLAVILDDLGVDLKKAKFILAEGADGAALTRTIPIEMAMDDVMVVYGQNGEMLRPENGYPLRLLVPGVQGVSSVKWLRRIEVGDKPWNTREEALHYIDLLPDGIHRQYTWIQECKSVITSPSGGQKLMDKGYYQINGLAWSGRGSVKTVDVSVDGGKNWSQAVLDPLVLPKALTRFRFDWQWNGQPAILQSRATDSTNYTQPLYSQLREVRVAVGVILPLTILNAGGRMWSSIGREAHPDEIAAWDTDVRPDGTGLKSGKGSVREGEVLYEQKCAVCHGSFGDSNEYLVIAGGVGSLKSASPVRTVGSKLNHATTLYDYINRAMPFQQPKSLTTDEVYSLTAYVLYLNEILPERAELDEKKILEVKMPNRNGFTEDHGFKTIQGKPDVKNPRCMKNCPGGNDKVSSELPDYAKNAHGNILLQNRIFGVMGQNTDPNNPNQPAYVSTSSSATAEHPGNDVLQKNGCTACHAPDRKIVGPSYKSLADKYGDGKTDIRQLIAKVKSGGAGNWGIVPMPPHPSVADSEIKTAIERMLLEY